MNMLNLDIAIVEAKRFLERAEELKKLYNGQVIRSTETMYHYPSDNATVKRASMDLTRALSKLRNS